MRWSFPRTRGRYTVRPSNSCELHFGVTTFSMPTTRNARGLTSSSIRTATGGVRSENRVAFPFSVILASAETERFSNLTGLKPGVSVCRVGCETEIDKRELIHLALHGIVPTRVVELSPGAVHGAPGGDGGSALAPRAHARP